MPPVIFNIPINLRNILELSDTLQKSTVQRRQKLTPLSNRDIEKIGKRVEKDILLRDTEKILKRTMQHRDIIESGRRLAGEILGRSTTEVPNRRVSNQANYSLPSAALRFYNNRGISSSTFENKQQALEKNKKMQWRKKEITPLKARCSESGKYFMYCYAMYIAINNIFNLIMRYYFFSRLLQF